MNVSDVFDVDAKLQARAELDVQRDSQLFQSLLDHALTDLMKFSVHTLFLSLSLSHPVNTWHLIQKAYRDFQEIKKA